MVCDARIKRGAIVAHCLALFASLAAHAAGGDPSGATPLPYQAPGKHLGVATCASSVCHGSVTSSTGHTIRLDEFVTWSHEDKHSQAYTALASEKGRSIAAKLGIGDARTAKVCLDCH